MHLKEHFVVNCQKWHSIQDESLRFNIQPIFGTLLAGSMIKSSLQCTKLKLVVNGKLVGQCLCRCLTCMRAQMDVKKECHTP